MKKLIYDVGKNETRHEARKTILSIKVVNGHIHRPIYQSVTRGTKAARGTVLPVCLISTKTRNYTLLSLTSILKGKAVHMLNIYYAMYLYAANVE